MQYTPVAAAPKTKSYVLHPLALVQRGVISYLVARVEPYQDVLLFAMHRLSSAQVLEAKPAHAPDGFTLAQYLQSGALQFSDGNSFALEVKINDDLAMHLRETPLSDDQTITAGEQWHKLTATVMDSWQLHWWILSQGEQIEIIAPTTLRAEIKQRLQQALQHYQSG